MDIDPNIVWSIGKQNRLILYKKSFGASEHGVKLSKVFELRDFGLKMGNFNCNLNVKEMFPYFNSQNAVFQSQRWHCWYDCRPSSRSSLSVLRYRHISMLSMVAWNISQGERSFPKRPRWICSGQGLADGFREVWQKPPMPKWNASTRGLWHQLSATSQAALNSFPRRLNPHSTCSPDEPNDS